ncbi:MAG: helix-hairpin-helix domain-containing protein [Chloroflexi bacterium]|nr:helix-hairpin-helix domain-containing protein [Chloroflexota bacterium]MDL1883841.1 helix-hairpin-helix domain-containing protein [Anaerolineae bacterium CFX8]
MRDDLPAEPSPRNTIIAFALAALAIIGGAVLLLAARPEPVRITINPPVPTTTPTPTATPGPITVYVTGAVFNPALLVSLPPGSRVLDAIEAAGGMTDTADPEGVNLAGFLRDGDQVHVPELGQTVTLPTPGGGGVVNINEATLEDLMTLPGIGPALAQRILDYRAANGPFANLEALDAVSGVGPALLEGLKDRVVFE